MSFWQVGGDPGRFPLGQLKWSSSFGDVGYFCCGVWLGWAGRALLTMLPLVHLLPASVKSPALETGWWGHLTSCLSITLGSRDSWKDVREAFAEKNNNQAGQIAKLLLFLGILYFGLQNKAFCDSPWIVCLNDFCSLLSYKTPSTCCLNVLKCFWILPWMSIEVGGLWGLQVCWGVLSCGGGQ